MAYDKDLPTSLTKIRNYPTVLTDNWAAIEEGDITLKPWTINMVRRQSVAGPIATDPTREDDMMFLFSKGAATEESEAYIMDDQNPANIIQVTQGGRLGGTSQGVSCSNLRFDAPIAPATFQSSYGINQMITAFGQFTNTGSLSFGLNMTGNAKVGNTYKISVDADVLLNSNYLVMLTCLAPDNSSERVINYITKPAPVAGVKTDITLAITSGSGGARSQQFQAIIIGGR